MLMIPKKVSTPMRSSSFRSASATVILFVVSSGSVMKKETLYDFIEPIRLFDVTEVAGIGNNL
jgi:aspartate carbamoyltransferase catalytic subunit